jgi:hypothetical protein
MYELLGLSVIIIIIISSSSSSSSNSSIIMPCMQPMLSQWGYLVREWIWG